MFAFLFFNLKVCLYFNFDRSIDLTTYERLVKSFYTQKRNTQIQLEKLYPPRRNWLVTYRTSTTKNRVVKRGKHATFMTTQF